MVRLFSAGKNFRQFDPGNNWNRANYRLCFLNARIVHSGINMAYVSISWICWPLNPENNFRLFSPKKSWKQPRSVQSWKQLRGVSSVLEKAISGCSVMETTCGVFQYLKPLPAVQSLETTSASSVLETISSCSVLETTSWWSRSLGNCFRLFSSENDPRVISCWRSYWSTAL